MKSIWCMLGIAAASSAITVVALRSQSSVAAPQTKEPARAELHVDGALRAQMARLERELGELKRERQGSARTSVEPEREENAGDESAAPRRRRVAKFIASLPPGSPVPPSPERFQKERRQGAWANQSERSLRSALSELGAESSVRALECRSSICQVELSQESFASGDSIARLDSLLDSTLVVTGFDTLVPGLGSQDKVKQIIYVEQADTES